MNRKVLKRATTGFLDGLPERGDGKGELYLDREWSETRLRLAQESGLGAQFGGKYLALDARVIRMARHAGACPVSIGVSCSADRNILGRITPEGIFLERLMMAPSVEEARLPEVMNKALARLREAYYLERRAKLKELLRQSPSLELLREIQELDQAIEAERRIYRGL
jgi:hypothetical protein